MSFLELGVTFIGLIPFFFLWRYLALRWSDNAVGKAMAVILS